MAHLFQPSLIPAIDSNGRVVSGAQLHAYLSGTLTKVTIYADHMETVAHPNPVPASSNGRFPPVYMRETIVHRVRLTDAAGALIPGCDVDPVNVYDPAGPVVRHYRFGGFATTPPTAGEVLAEHVVTDAFTLPVDMVGSLARAGDNPAQPWTLDVQRNGASIGSISLSTAGVSSFVTLNREPVSVAAGDVISFVAPQTADAALARLCFTLKGVI